MKQFLKEEKGNILIVAPFLISILLLFGAFGMDTASAFLLKHQIQATADAAALAGASATMAPFARDEYGEIIPGVVDLQIDPDTADIEAMFVLDQNILNNKLEQKGVTILEKTGEIIDPKNYRVVIKAKIDTPLGFGTGNEAFRTVVAVAKVNE